MFPEFQVLLLQFDSKSKLNIDRDTQKESTDGSYSIKFKKVEKTGNLVLWLLSLANLLEVCSSQQCNSRVRFEVRGIVRCMDLPLSSTMRCDIAIKHKAVTMRISDSKCAAQVRYGLVDSTNDLLSPRSDYWILLLGSDSLPNTGA